MKKITITDVAARAGVSKSTVSQFLNKRFDYMSKETKERVEVAINELEYQPNIIARSLKQRTTRTIGVIVANILHDFSTRVIRAIEDYCHEEDYHVIVCNADDDPVKEKRYIDMLRAKQVDGIIAFPTSKNTALYQDLITEHYPFVFMDRLVPGIETDTVLLNNHEAAQLAVDQLVANGYRKIAMLAPPLYDPITPRVERIEGYKASLETHDICLNSSYVISARLEEMEEQIEKLLSLSDPPEAILALNDRVMIQLLQYVKDKQIRISDDVAVIGIDDVTFASLYTPALTTIAQPAFEMGKKAAQLLFNQFHNEASQGNRRVYRFSPQIIIRESCKRKENGALQ
ncbi:LacI family transcriptional regulator [Virgibacillus pantothenticus]|uniref:LacI family transcriptional regulator n=1 Tax=Virgibacillus pantothenticus TaxID=1473 RepID=A0A0L0QS00_VIRPA|nr:MULTISPECIES: substrate-binding domain-containing protein [Virgibacillus]API92000.1 LacI family transcriptional regulator [Virgibacillus sp. 6R]KNE21369.1 LacI family transcriptional regulator [Virgibacillus pantothenticus]MBS7430459.1 substrate-binding domain-containing protein [Virgibacillus sp. 19R1-5]MBU8566397.1 substrate-binding domain-containing protein [Virgibacillus pantothenticus]MBU8600187.1 substrate-binding domain-containing protein [Virgibacillus pantothenticus]